jgi:hypothetical protein
LLHIFRGLRKAGHAANTTYVASHHTNGVYTATNNFFTNAISSGTLTAPSCDNGVYSYWGTSTAGIFPTSAFNGTNYFADVVFSSSATPPPIASHPSNQQPPCAHQTASYRSTACMRGIPA